MKPMRWILALLAFTATQRAHAEIAVAPTLEWLADHCIDSGVYQVTEATKLKDLTASYKVAFTLDEALRGDPAKSVEERYGRFPFPAPEDPPFVEVGDRFLICFQHYESGERRVVQLINLFKPSTASARQIAVTSDVKILTDGNKIVDVFRDRLKKRPKGDPAMMGDRSKDSRYELRPDMAPYEGIYAGSKCYLNIPVDLMPKGQD
jgi:hypothetical protein